MSEAYVYLFCLAEANPRSRVSGTRSSRFTFSARLEAST
jgi:hypothetical protein